MAIAGLLAIAACRQDLDILTDATLEGRYVVQDFTVGPGVTVIVTGDLDIDASGRVVIDGELRGPDESGVDIRLATRRGNIEINGEIAAGSGRNGADRAGSGDIIVTDLAAVGGDVTLAAASGNVIIRGDVSAGNGGNGGSATASGAGPVQRAESGAGAAGGRVLISAGRDIDIGGASGALHAGDGGTGGRSDATIQTDDDPETDDLPQGRALATSRAGGGGGEIQLRLTTARGTMLLQGEVEAGDGGDSSGAMANGGEAEAITDRAATGGNIILEAPNEAQLMPPTTDPAPGDGGDNGVPAAPDQAFAIAVTSGLARVGAGGDAGVVLRNATGIDAGTGGSNGNALVRLAGNPTASPGQLAVDRTPAPEHQARVP